MAIIEGTRAINYANDIIIGGRFPDDVLQVANQVFRRIQEHGMKINFKKMIWCSW